jgi:hypothetical protein
VSFSAGLRPLVPAVGAAALGLTLAASAGAASDGFSIHKLAEPATPGLAVTGPLRGYRATANGRVLLPASWRRSSASAGHLRMLATQNANCRYAVTYSIRSTLAPDQRAADYVAARLPSMSARHLLDSGERGGRAFRVVRRSGVGARVRLDALWAGVLTKRSDVTPAGRVAWTEIRVSAVSREGDECHSGTWRQALGPTIGDSLAVARATLRFTRAG